MADIWQGPPIRACLDELSVDTVGNVDETLRWARKLGATELLVVSSWWHVRLLALYSRRPSPRLLVRHERLWRWHGVPGHLVRELRGLPQLVRWRSA
jgi:uncharacterized SAM-binding protein YcdF (DUF218 family)